MRNKTIKLEHLAENKPFSFVKPISYYFWYLRGFHLHYTYFDVTLALLVKH